MTSKRASEPILLRVRVDGKERHRNFVRPALWLDELARRFSANR